MATPRQLVLLNPPVPMGIMRAGPPLETVRSVLVYNQAFFDIAAITINGFDVTGGKGLPEWEPTGAPAGLMVPITQWPPGATVIVTFDHPAPWTAILSLPLSFHTILFLIFENGFTLEGDGSMVQIGYWAA
jgi:hypothetical protein